MPLKNAYVRVVDGQGEHGSIFTKLSLGATLFAVGLEIISTCDVAKDTVKHVISQYWSDCCHVVYF